MLYTVFPRIFAIRLVTLVAAAASLLATSEQASFAASVTVETDPDGFSMIVVDGELNPVDVLVFERLANSQNTPAVVLFSSPGGDLKTGIEIGRIIRSKGLATGVTDTCASACALAWLAGRMRFASSAAQIGFHVAYIGDELRSVTGTGNAMVGLYVGELGLGENVVRYVTEAPPEGMTWLSFRDAELLGIDVTPLDELPSNETASIAPTERLPSLRDAEVPGFDPANAARAVQNTLERYQQAGITGLVESSRACWNVAITKKQMQSVQYCRVLDIMARQLDEAAVSMYGFPQTEYFIADDRALDLLAAFANAGISDPDLVLRFNELWQSQTTQAMEQAAQ